MLVTARPVDGLRSVDDVRRDIQHGWSANLWKQLVEKVEREIREPPIAAGQQNRSYLLVARTCNRIMDTALVALISNDRQYAESALQQIEALFDERMWPDWADKAHLQAGLNSDLRHGQFARAIGLAYDWLYNLLTDQERKRIVAGVDRFAIQRFKASIAANESWITRQSNWKTSVVGGFGVLGMALGPDHKESRWLQEFSQPLMDKYMEVFGPNGEFNESPPYASSTMYVISYYLAQYYASGGKQRPVQLEQLRNFSYWFLYCSLPPSRTVVFGDGHPNTPLTVFHFAAVASALRDPIIQWMYLQHVESERTDSRRRAQELLFFDPTVKPQSPDGRLPLGRNFPAQSGIVTSRSSWNPSGATSIVHCKARTEDVHRHADWGQVCLDGFGRRLLVDLGSPPVYPRSDKRQYYNYQQSGHNVLSIGVDDLDVTWRVRRQGTTIRSQFDDDLGGTWSIDLSDVYSKDRKVWRHVIHLLPRTLVVLDDAMLPTSERVRLRWHTATEAELGPNGGFVARNRDVTLLGHVVCIGRRGKIVSDRHEYRPPYDKGRLGQPYPQRHEPFVELEQRGERFRGLSLFCVAGPNEVSATAWENGPNGWSIHTPEGPVNVALQEDTLVARNLATSRGWRIELKSDKRP